MLNGIGLLDYNQLNTQRESNFHQLNVRVDKKLFLDKFNLNFYLDIQNVYGHKTQLAPILLVDTDANGASSNDITFALEYSVRDDVNSNSRLDQSNAFATGGQKVVSIKPTVDCVLSNRVNLQLYFDQRRINPYVSNSAPSVNTRAGVQIRISLAQ